jgi:hypothetical protein
VKHLTSRFPELAPRIDRNNRKIQIFRQDKGVTRPQTLAT